MGKAGRVHSGSSGPTSLFKKGHPRAHATGLHPGGSWISPGGLYNLSESPTQQSSSSYSDETSTVLVYTTDHSMRASYEGITSLWHNYFHHFTLPSFPQE